MNLEAQQRIMGFFIEEARDHLATIEQGLLSLKNSLTDPELINDLFRAAHSIKGGSAMLGLTSIQRTAHRMEDFFNIFRSNPGKVPVDQHLESLLLRQFDTLSMLMEELQSPTGLSEATGTNALAALEPVFAETETHIHNLMREGVSATPQPTPTPAPAPAKTSNLESIMSQVVPQLLRQMLDLFKQGDQPAVREKLLKISQTLTQVGIKYQLTQWQALTQAITSAIQQTTNDFKTLAPITLRDLKQAQQLVVQNQAQQIALSPELVALTQKPAAPSPSPAPAMTEAQKRILGFFLEEAAEHLVTLEQGLLNLKETVADQEAIQELFRASHSIKGGAAQLGLASIQRIGHRLEDFFSIFRDRVGRIPVDEHLEGLLLRGYDSLSKLLGYLQETGELPETMASAALTDMEPVFVETENYIRQLMGEAPSAAVPKVATVAPTTAATPVPTKSPAPAMTEAQKRILGFFLEEAAEHLVTIEQGLLNLKQTVADQEAIQEIFRASHSIKGGSAQLGLTSIQRISHRMEDFFSLFRDHVGKIPADEHLESLLIRSYDALSRLLAHVQETGELPEEMGSAAVAEMAPIFAETESHIQQLLGQGPAQPAVSAPTALDQVIQQEIPQLLRQMLEQFKQVTQTDIRPTLQTICQSLLAIGTDYQLTEWIQLVHVVQEVLEHSDQPLKELAVPVLKDLKQAHQQLLVGQSSSIKASSELLALRQSTETLFETSDFETADDLGSLFGDAGDIGGFDDELLNLTIPEDDHSDDLSTGIVLADDGDPEGFKPLVDEGNLSDLFGSSDLATADSSNYYSNSPDAEALSLDAESYSPTPLTLAEDDEMAFADLFANAEELAAIEENFDTGISTTSVDFTQDENALSKRIDEAKADGDLVELFADMADFDPKPGSASDDTAEDDAFFADLFGYEQTDEDKTATPSTPGTETSGLGLGVSSFEQLFYPETAAAEDDTNTSTSDADASQSSSFSDFSIDLEGLFDDVPLSSDSQEEPPAASTPDPEFDKLDQLFGQEVGTTGLALDTTPSSALDTDKDGQVDLDELDSFFAGSDQATSSDFDSQLDELLRGEPLTTEPSAPWESELAGLLDTDTPPAGSGSLDELDALLGELTAELGSTPQPTPTTIPVPVVAATTDPPKTTKKSGSFATPTMRVEVKHLDSINNLVGELVVNRNSMEQNQGRLRQFLEGLLNRVQQLSDLGQQMQDQYDRSLLETALLSGRSGGGTSGNNHNSSRVLMARSATDKDFDPLEMDRFTAFHALSQEIIELIVRVRESSSDIEFAVDEAEQVARQFRQVTTQLQEGLNRARMVPFSQIADRLPRAIRDLSIKTKKRASLEVEGRETLIDKAILEELFDPMTHLVNNALVHGIESPDERQRAGKSQEGKITIRAFYQGNQTIIVVSDNGGGINTEKVKQKALGLGLIPNDAEEDEIFNVLFHPGFSGRSAEEVDDLAGRGVGLDVVRRNITELRGSIQVDSTRGQGTTFTIRLPLTLSISKAMVCVSDKALIAFPLDGVEEMLDVPQDEIQIDEKGRPTIPWREGRLHYQPLSDLLTYSRIHSRGRAEVYSITQDEGIVPIVILQSGGQYVALQVDSFVEEQEIVIKQLRGPAPKPPGIAGATVLGNGRVLPIADIIELVEISQGKLSKGRILPSAGQLWGDQEAEETEHQTTVLIIDDSITVRELLSMTFNKGGYRVEQARDGQDAWEKLRGGLPCDLIFCDIEMPRMDGLELLSRVREDDILRHLPIAMLTSRGAERHRQTARELGATAYFTKPYLEEELLSAAAKMLKGEVLLEAKR